MGMCSQLLSCFSRKPIFGIRAMVTPSCYRFLGFMSGATHVHERHEPYTAFAFSIMTMGIGVPRHQDLQLAWHAHAREDSFIRTHAVCHRIKLFFVSAHQRAHSLPSPFSTFLCTTRILCRATFT